jgi:hypothetical protein
MLHRINTPPLRKVNGPLMNGLMEERKEDFGIIAQNSLLL